MPDEQCDDLQAMAGEMTYGWGMIPIFVRIGDRQWRTSLWPKDGRFVIPLKDKVRQAEALGDVVEVGFSVARAPRSQGNELRGPIQFCLR